MSTPPPTNSPFASSNSSTASSFKDQASGSRISTSSRARSKSPSGTDMSTTTTTVTDTLPPYRAPSYQPPTYILTASGRFLDLVLRTSKSTEYYLSVLTGHDPPLLLRAGPSPSSPIVGALRFGKFPDGQLCLGDPLGSPNARWTPWARELGFKTFSFSIPGPNGGASGSRRLRWEKSRSRKHGLATLGRTKGWVLRNLDTDEVLASFKQEQVGVGKPGEKVGELKWFSDVTSDEEIGSTMVLVGMWFRMSQLEIGGDYERVFAAQEGKGKENVDRVHEEMGDVSGALFGQTNAFVGGATGRR
ncbi:hypothetical protein KVT40_004519 [Elsinoe batatas]|uniref:Uncharacterized protein n=1 Tax=Elsinoe batatas TaxID=2601811 RepID=A0A8K0L3I4_9PEZI|nr:hypothetical protein KVT40_004519 [Elsinoe batatas]